MAEEHRLIEIPQLAIEETRVDQRNRELDPAVGVHCQHAEQSDPRRIDEPSR